MAKQKRATDELNVALEGMSSAMSLARTLIAGGESSKAIDCLVRGAEYYRKAADALTTIQFHSRFI